MILNCNSCGKKFVVPDDAITASGRMVQCGSCGNKWRQFPVDKTKKTSTTSKSQPVRQKIQKIKQTKKSAIKKTREISLYSPEYLAKKHGIKINDVKSQTKTIQNKNGKVAFGFYNSLIVFIFLTISISRILYFSQNFIISLFPKTEFYLNNFFESIRNLFEIWKNLITY